MQRDLENEHNEVRDALDSAILDEYDDNLQMSWITTHVMLMNELEPAILFQGDIVIRG
jgi:hypothetical protein